MGFDVAALRKAVKDHGRVVRVVIAAIRGSSPREPGTAMLVWDGGQSGTIGGGSLEFEAAAAARLQAVARTLSTHALGPGLGQCCGGAVTLLSEVFHAADLAALDEEIIARPVSPAPVPPSIPMPVKRILAAARSQGIAPKPQLAEGWMIEPVHRPAQPVWIWGAGHVGRALAGVLAPLPDLEITWIDTAADRFPALVPPGVTTVPASDPALVVPHAPENAMHLVLTYSHALDLALCHALLGRGFAFAGLIGSKTKWARFRSRLAALGRSPEQISRITCPIGDPQLGKHPQMIAVGVAAQLLRLSAEDELRKDRRA
ncbi:xanthine dehydrogenase accessory protein XdhC [Leisingera methylohalidivorans]|uniref:Molybdenum cofactor sulfurylase n=1 Tax=Leisingera methylohalidivorans DSM 14336 TaxID=999552 RepID=V9VQL8_9RHOB|nr:xanthine dehydrogenase accessory protein XdhC [Leisingera methylohalidivorans]AHC99993.1 molybdenum cofactor sulfurylase [Leisingera methylohalidivorans DSM 14336]